MSIREQLEELLESTKLTLKDRCLIKKLIAERPYEPGETILVGRDVDELLKYPMKRKYIASWKDKVIVESQTSGVDVWPYSFHKPIPKTCRLKPVPVEVMETAKKILHKDAETKEDTGEGWYKEETIRMAEWLANPDNWEADDE